MVFRFFEIMNFDKKFLLLKTEKIKQTKNEGVICGLDPAHHTTKAIYFLKSKFIKFVF